MDVFVEYLVKKKNGAKEWALWVLIGAGALLLFAVLMYQIGRAHV